MVAKLPYMASPGLIPKILAKIEEARRPERFTQDFLETKLGHSGGGARAFIPLLKRMEFLASDGTPTKLYDQFRNPSTRGTALAAGLRNAYSEVFDRNQYAGDLSRDKLGALITEMTGLEKDSRVGQLIVSTFWALKDGADLDGGSDAGEEQAPDTVAIQSAPQTELRAQGTTSDEVKLNVGYNINLNLPETTNPEVFNAIFKSLKEHLLRV